VAVLAHDRYYRDQRHLTPDARAGLNFDHPEALDTELLVTHLAALQGGRAIEAPVYDFARHVRATDVERVDPKPTILVEGVLVLADDRLRAAMHLKVFVDTQDDERFARRLARDVADRGRTPESVRRQHETTVLPMHRRFVEPSRAHADMIVQDGGFNDAAIERLMAMIAALRSDRARPRRG
jgi:uridine kinase